jgi:hypothetical protein
MEMINDTIRTKAVELTENQSVLFADDNFILHKLSSISVAKAAPMWKIEEAANGETTLGLVDSKPYDLISSRPSTACTS